MSRLLPAVRLVGGVVVLAVLLWRFGTGPFAAAWGVTGWGPVVLTLLLTGLATVASAWRWRVVAGALDAPLTPLASLTAYYRSQFLNATLPGGILGDAHRGVRHGRASGDLGVGLRAVAWERGSGQLVQAAVLVAALFVLPTPWRGLAPAALVVVLAIAALFWWLAGRRGALDFVGDDLAALLQPRVAARIGLASSVCVAAHLGVFWVASSTVGVTASPGLLSAVGLLVLVGSAVPLSVAGWGPREGVTAAVFALAGLGSTTGLTVSVVFGVLSTLATLPGGVVLLADLAVRRRTGRPAPAAADLEGACRG